MEYFNKILCISGKELIRSDRNPNGLISKSGYDSLVHRKKLNVLRPGKGEGSPALIEFDSLPPKYKALAIERFGDPVVESQKQGIMDYLEKDLAAVDFFSLFTIEYRDNEKGLPEEIQTIYSNNAAILNAIQKAWDEHVLASRSRNKRPLANFWVNASKAIKGLPADWENSLPVSRIRETLKKYNEYGYVSLISGKWGNENTVKITDEAGEWIVAQWMSRIKIVTIEQLHARYNVKADEMGWKKLKSSNAVRDYLYRPEIEVIWHAARYGELSAKEKFTREHKTWLPKYRDALWYSDGTKLNFFYQDENGDTKTWNVYEVVDVYSECFLGYHISKTEDFEAQYHAFKMAIQTSKHKPYELKYDGQGGHKKLENGDLLKNIARLSVRTAPYNGKSKTIESIFGRFQAECLHEEWYFTGQNITSKKKESRGNMEFILANLKNLPTLDEVKEVYKKHRETWNNSKHPKTGIARSEMYRTSVNEKTQEVDFLDMITVFGITTKAPSTYRASGIEIDVKTIKYEYEVLGADGMPDMDFNRRNIGRKFYVRYTPDDMSIVSLYEKDASGLRFITIAQPYVKVFRAAQDQTTESLSFIRTMEIKNKLQRIAAEKERNEILERHNLHPNQHGLNVAKPKGINIAKKKLDIGEMQKEVSNMTEIEEKKKTAQKISARVQKQSQQKTNDDQRDFDKRRIEMMKVLMN